MKNDLAIFEEHEIRRAYDEETETWFFSVIDIVQILTEQTDYQTARKYWNKLKERLKKEGNQPVTNCHRLKNLRDHMSEAELIFTALAELSTRQIAETMNATDMEENKLAGKKGGGIAKKARLKLEDKTGKKVVPSNNYLPYQQNPKQNK